MLVILQCPFPLADKQNKIGQSGWCPSSTLFVKLVKALWAVSAVFCCGAICQSPASLDHECTHPAVFTLWIEEHMNSCLVGIILIDRAYEVDMFHFFSN